MAEVAKIAMMSLNHALNFKTLAMDRETRREIGKSRDALDKIVSLRQEHEFLIKSLKYNMPSSR